MDDTTPMPALFFDRDGVLNIDKAYVYTREDFEWRAGAIDAIRALNEAGWRVFVITNQSGIARGYYGEADVQALHQWMNDELALHGAHIDAFYYCPHHPAEGGVAPYNIACECRKPAPGMLFQAMAEWDIDAARSLMIGDKTSDTEAAHAAGIKGLLIAPEDDLAGLVNAAIASATL